MSRFLPAGCRGQGWLALALALALHGAFGGLMALLSAHAGRGTISGSAPVIVREVEIDGGDGEAHLIPAAGAGKGIGNAAPLQVGMTAGAENIVPVAHAEVAPAPPGGGGVAGPAGADAGGKRGSSGLGSGPPSFFQVGTQAERIVYVIDRSGSMGAGGLLAAARRELLASLSRLPPRVHFQIVVYHHEAEYLLGRRELLPATPENVAQVAQALTALHAEGATDHLRAMRLALGLGAQVIYLLTDADDLTDAARREITRLNAGRTVIHTIELNTANRGRPDMPLQVLARDNGGRYQAVDPR
jgi:hypothetical protein